jgi:RNA polymerase sigma-70 factor, ECF subfamily
VGDKSHSHSQALNAFLATIERRAYRMAYFAVQDRDEALDIVQDAMLNLVRRYSGAAREEWPPLFHRILQHRIRDHYRRQKVRAVVRSWFGGDESDDQDELAATPAAAPGPQEQLMQGQAVEQLNRAIESLPLRQQQVFLLRAWEGLDVRDTAAAVGCSEGSIKTHYSRAVAKLREMVGEHWDAQS